MWFLKMRSFVLITRILWFHQTLSRTCFVVPRQEREAVGVPDSSDVGWHFWGVFWVKILCFKKLQFRVHSSFSVVVCRLVWVELRYRLLRFFFGGLTTNLSFHVIVLKSETKAVWLVHPQKKVHIITDRFQQPICLGSELKSKKM